MRSDPPNDRARGSRGSPVAARTTGTGCRASLARSRRTRCPSRAGRRGAAPPAVGHSPSRYAIDWNRNPRPRRPGRGGRRRGRDDGAGHAQGRLRPLGGRRPRQRRDLALRPPRQRRRRRSASASTRARMIGTLGDSGNSSGSHLHFEEKVGRSVVPAVLDGAAYRDGAQTSVNCVDVPLAGQLHRRPRSPRSRSSAARRGRRSSSTSSARDGAVRQGVRRAAARRLERRRAARRRRAHAAR